MKRFVIKGNICYSNENRELCIIENGYTVCENGICAGTYKELPKCYEIYPCYDYTDKLIIPGFADLHVHAPQYSFRGLGMDLELLDWLNTHTFVEEAKYQEIDYAEKAYSIFAEDILKSPTTRACVFGTVHNEATLILMKKLENAGIKGFVGKVNMDRNSPAYICEESPEKSAENTEAWIQKSKSLENIKPILTPRFIPTCSDELMEKLSVLQKNIIYQCSLTFLKTLEKFSGCMSYVRIRNSMEKLMLDTGCSEKNALLLWRIVFTAQKKRCS